MKYHFSWVPVCTLSCAKRGNFLSGKLLNSSETRSSTQFLTETVKDSGFVCCNGQIEQLCSSAILPFLVKLNAIYKNWSSAEFSVIISSFIGIKNEF